MTKLYDVWVRLLVFIVGYTIMMSIWQLAGATNFHPLVIAGPLIAWNLISGLVASLTTFWILLTDKY